jgi:2-haloacid dehalogenase
VALNGLSLRGTAIGRLFGPLVRQIAGFRYTWSHINPCTRRRPPVRYTTFLLDLDHTLFDSDTSEAAAFAATLAAVGVTEPERYKQMYQRINLDLWAAVERGETSANIVRTRRFELLVDEAGFDADPQVMSDAFVAGLVDNGELYTGARELLEELAMKASLALITNGLSEAQRGRVERLGIGRYFDAVVISAEIGAAKPDTAIFDAAFEQLGFPTREQALMVGDSLTSDIQGGTNYGVDTCWYNPHGAASGPNDQITHQIHKLDELLRIAD